MPTLPETVQVNTDSTSAIAYSNLGLQHLRQGDVEKAFEYCQHALQLDPNLAAAWINWSAVLQTRGAHTDALQAAHKAVELAPTLADTHAALGGVAREMGYVSLATRALLEATRLNNPHAEAWCNLALALLDQAQIEQAFGAIGNACRLRPHDLSFASNRQLIAQYHETFTAADLRAIAAEFDTAITQAGIIPLAARPLVSRKRLRVAYLSADLRAHPVGLLLQHVLPAHSARECIDISVYATWSGADDWLSAELKKFVPQWHNVANLDDITLAERIYHDDIDVLIDLSGHTAHNRLGVFARKPATVQLSFLGWFASTGMCVMDAVLLGQDQLTRGHESFFTERVIALPGAHFRYSGTPYAPFPTGILPSQQRGYITFGSFNNTAKLNTEVVQCWADLLLHCPNSRLLLKWKTFIDLPFQATLKTRFERLGVAPERIILRGASEHASMLAEYAEVDVALDPFPFCGGMTSLEALWQGVPVITLRQIRPISRQGFSLLHTLGLDDLAVTCVADYVQRAAELAADVGRRQTLRKTLRQRIASSELGNGVSLASALEETYAAQFALILSKRKGV